VVGLVVGSVGRVVVGDVVVGVVVGLVVGVVGAVGVVWAYIDSVPPAMIIASSVFFIFVFFCLVIKFLLSYMQLACPHGGIWKFVEKFF
jgi:hypothetical protein